MTLELITIIGGLISTATSGWTGWYFGRRKYNSEVESNLIENMQKSLDFYDKLSNNNKEKLDQTIEENKQMKFELEAITKENKQLKDAIDNITNENQSMRNKIDELQNQIVLLSHSICTDLKCQLRNENFSTLDIDKEPKKTIKNEKGKSRKTV